MSTPNPRWDEATAKIVTGQLLDDGWTCEYHEPDDRCSDCARAHALTAGRILAALADAGLLTSPQASAVLQRSVELAAEIRVFDTDGWEGEDWLAAVDAYEASRTDTTGAQT